MTNFRNGLDHIEKYGTYEAPKKCKYLNGVSNCVNLKTLSEKEAIERVNILINSGYSAFYDKARKNYVVWWSFFKTKDCVRFISWLGMEGDTGTYTQERFKVYPKENGFKWVKVN